MPVSCNIGGTWRTVIQPYCNIGGVWRTSQPYCNIGGTWRNASTTIDVNVVSSVEICVSDSYFGDGSASNQYLTLTASRITAYATRPSSSSYVYSANARGVIVLTTLDYQRYVVPSSRYANGVYYYDINATATDLIPSNTNIKITSTFGGSPASGGNEQWETFIINGVFGRGANAQYYSQYGSTVGPVSIPDWPNFKVAANKVSSDTSSSSSGYWNITSVTNNLTSAAIPYSINSVVPLS